MFELKKVSRIFELVKEEFITPKLTWHSDYRGLCAVIDNLFIGGIITSEEKELVEGILRRYACNREDRQSFYLILSEPYYVPLGEASGFYWREGLKEPRIIWLDDMILKYKKYGE